MFIYCPRPNVNIHVIFSGISKLLSKTTSKQVLNIREYLMN